MAYMNQDRKKELMPGIKKVLAKYNAKATFRIEHGAKLVCTVKSSDVAFYTDYRKINVYHINSQYALDMQAFLSELYDAMMAGNHDDSDIQTDYFNVGWYVGIQIGTYKKSYVFTGIPGKLHPAYLEDIA